MSKGTERLMTQGEFLDLMNKAYDFVKVVCPADVAEFIFKKTDTDEDGFITYIQYFQVIEAYICKNPNYKVPKSEGKPDKVGEAHGP